MTPTGLTSRGFLLTVVKRCCYMKQKSPLETSGLSTSETGNYSLVVLGAAGAGVGAAAAGALSVVVVTGAGAAVLDPPL